MCKGMKNMEGFTHEECSFDWQLNRNFSQAQVNIPSRCDKLNGSNHLFIPAEVCSNVCLHACVCVCKNQL